MFRFIKNSWIVFEYRGVEHIGRTGNSENDRIKAVSENGSHREFYWSECQSNLRVQNTNKQKVVVGMKYLMNMFNVSNPFQTQLVN